MGIQDGWGLFAASDVNDYGEAVDVIAHEYTTSDGKVVKVPNSYDYVYEGENGNIYASNSTDQPAGSTRLYAN